MLKRGKDLKTGSVLLVEDSGEVRDVVVEILTREGFKVKSADDGLAAWKMLNSESFDLIISDMDVPGMDGERLLANLRKKSVETPVLLTSGVSTAKVVLGKSDFPGYRLLHKPFEINEMKKAIAELIDEK